MVASVFAAVSALIIRYFDQGDRCVMCADKFYLLERNRDFGYGSRCISENLLSKFSDQTYEVSLITSELIDAVF